MTASFTQSPELRVVFSFIFCFPGFSKLMGFLESMCLSCAPAELVKSKTKQNKQLQSGHNHILCSHIRPYLPCCGWDILRSLSCPCVQPMRSLESFVSCFQGQFFFSTLEEFFIIIVSSSLSLGRSMFGFLSHY